MRFGWRLALVALYAPIACAQAPGNEAIDWLQRLYIATKNLSYSGTFVYQHGHLTETSRITRYVDGSGSPRERIEVLDGSPREIIRAGNEVKAYLPGTMTVKVERAANDQPLLPILPLQVRDLPESYRIVKGELERIAGFDTQAIILEPKDNLRYGHKMWADVATAMLVKAQTFDEKREVVEQFMFTQLRIGGGVAKGDLRSRFEGKAKNWRVEESGGGTPAAGESAWAIRTAPSGFKKLTEMKRTLPGSADAVQIVLSDGVAAVSVFIESAASRAPLTLGPSRQGAINIYTRKIDSHLVTVVGEAPADCVRVIAQGVERRNP
jgi:sigma-E factor negative regulatory protein RseB